MAPRPSGTGTENGLASGALETSRRGVYAGFTPLSFGVFGRHRRGLDPVEPCGFARLGASSDDS
jgi:hypothetical protein